MLQAEKGMVCEQLKILIGRNLIKEMEPDKWVRNVLDKTTGTAFFLCLRESVVIIIIALSRLVTNCTCYNIKKVAVNKL